MKNNISVITIDGPSGSGKGTIARLLAKKLGWHILDSGSLYRAFAWAIITKKIDWQNPSALNELLAATQLELIEGQPGEKVTVKCDGQDITTAIREEACSIMASKISAIPSVREATMPYQRQMRKAPGLVADGRDMGTVVFPDAKPKFFLTASPVERARRRQLQLLDLGQEVDLFVLQQEINERDRRDRERAIAPTKPAEDAIVISTTDLSIEEVLEVVCRHLTV